MKTSELIKELKGVIDNVGDARITVSGREILACVINGDAEGELELGPKQPQTDHLLKDVYALVDCWERHERNPETFKIPSDLEIATLRAGDSAKLIFQGPAGGNWLWVEIQGRKGPHFTGRLDDDPIAVPGMKLGDNVEFHFRHIADVHRKEQVWPDDS